MDTITPARALKVLLIIERPDDLREASEHFVGLGFDVEQLSSTHAASDYLAVNGAEVGAVIADCEIMVGSFNLIDAIRSSADVRSISFITLVREHMKGRIPIHSTSGTHYSLPFPLGDKRTLSTVNAALDGTLRRRRLVEQVRSISLLSKSMTSCRLHIKTIEEAEDAACLLSSMFPDPERATSGILELLVNAIEHGNLEIGHREKSRMIGEDTWLEGLQERYDMPRFRNRTVECAALKKADGTYLVITDQGPGFDWRSIMSVDTSWNDDSNGRGIALAKNVSFDRVTYNAKGNRVVAFAEKSSNLSW